jgi:hypothetical protein
MILPMAFFKENVLQFLIVQYRNFLLAWTIISDIHETRETERQQESSFKLRTP